MSRTPPEDDEMEESIPTLGPKDLEEQDDESDVYDFAEDVYTMMFFSDPSDWAYCFGVFVFAFQMTILGLIGYSLLNDNEGKREGDDTEYNFFNVPVLVDTEVLIAQFLALFLAVVSRDEVTNTLGLVSVGYSTRCQESFPKATYFSFIQTNFFRFFMGISVVFVSLIFIVQADNVLDIFLNFAAIEFVATIDDLAYTLAKEGWVGSPIKRFVKKIEEEKIQLPECKLDFLRHYARPMSVSVLLAGLYAVWIFLIIQQQTGEFLKRAGCQTVAVKFGDEVYSLSEFQGFKAETVEKLETSYRIDGSKRRIRFDPREKDAIPDLHYSYFSGNYEAEFDSLKINNRPVYYERGEKDDSTSGMFYYCDAEKSWVFTIKVFAQSENIKEGDDTVVPKETIDRCKDGGWLMRSPITEAFLLDQVPTDSWSIWTGTLNVASDFSITCAECDSDIDCGLRNGKCNSGTCTCEEGRYRGNFCNVVEPCDKLQYFPGGERELSAGSLPPTTEEEPFLVKKEVTAYDRPIYSSSIDSESVATLLYTGRRWYSATLTNEALSDAHVYWDDVVLTSVNYISEVTEAYEPTGSLKWFELPAPFSIGNYGPFGLNYQSTQRYECLSVDCKINHVCGLEDTDESFCKENMTLADNLTRGGKCDCTGRLSPDADDDDDDERVLVEDDYYYGHFCEFRNESEDEVQDDDNGDVAGAPV